MIFINKDNYTTLLDFKKSSILVYGATGLLVITAIVAIRNLPFIDFRSYAIGNNIPALMKPSSDLIYEYVMTRDGIEFRFKEYPTDNNYEFKEMVITNPEVQPKITDLAVWKNDIEYTNELFRGNKLLIIIQSIEKTDTDNSKAIKTIGEKLNNATTWVLTSSSKNDYKKFSQAVQWNFPFFFTDATVLKTIVRSSPGIVLLKDGVVAGKWHYNNTPTIKEIESIL